MSLHVSNLFVPTYAIDNWGANPSATPGASVTAGHSGNEGSWTASGLGVLTHDIIGFHLRVADAASTSATVNNMFLDIGVDPAGGTSYVSLVNNLVVGGAGPITFAAGGVKSFWPLGIPAGATVGFRARRVTPTTAYTLRVSIKCWGMPGGMANIPVGSFCETLGATEDTSVDATSITPGNAADGSWVSLGTLTNPCWHFNLGYQIDNTLVTAEYTYIDLAVGDASNKFIVRRILHAGNSTEYYGDAFGWLAPWDGIKPCPAGTTLYARGRCNNAPDTGYQVAAYAIGG